jgi:hypothetical protein
MTSVWAAAVLLLGLAARAGAGELISELAEVGPHYRVVLVDKSVHPRNRLAAFTRLDAQCRVARDPDRGNGPVFDFYWLMDGVRYKRVNWLIKRGIRRRLEVEDSPPSDASGSFAVRLNEFSEVVNDLGPAPLFRVVAEKTERGCRAEARISLGPSDGGAAIRLDAIDSEADVTGPFTAKVRSITLKGADLATGKPVVRVYRAR